MPRPKDPLRLSPLLQAPSGQVLEAVRKLGLEGVVGKRIDSIYEPGERSGAWIKLRTNMEQEFVIGGYIPGARGFDALLVGVYEQRTHLRCEGEERVCAAIGTRSSRLSRRCKLPSAHSRICLRKGLAVGRIANRRENGPMPLGQTEAGLPGRFVEWTDAGHLRHCTFIGMRDDKKPPKWFAKLEAAWGDAGRDECAGLCRTALG